MPEPGFCARAAHILIADELWIAPVFDPIAHGELTDPWSAFGLDMSAAIPYAVNTLQRRSISQDDVVAEPKQRATIDYRTVEHPSVAGSAVWNFERPVEIDGLGLWFKAFIMDDLSYSTSPFEPSTVYGMVYAPLADRMSIGAGDSLRVRVRGGPGGRFVRLDLEHRPRIQRSVSATFASPPFFRCRLRSAISPDVIPRPVPIPRTRFRQRPWSSESWTVAERWTS